MAVAYNVVIDQGANWFLNVNYNNPNGTPVNLAGYSGALQMRSYPDASTAVLSLTSAAGGGITITAITGLVAISATAAQTRAIDEGTYYYDLEITDTFTGVVTRLVQGQAVVSAEVTR
jgi:hypothetical protein